MCTHLSFQRLSAFLLSIQSSIRTFIHPSIYPSTHSSIKPSINPPTPPSIRPSLRQFMDPSIQPPIHPRSHHSMIHPFRLTHLPTHLSSHPFFCCSFSLPSFLFHSQLELSFYAANDLWRFMSYDIALYRSWQHRRSQRCLNSDIQQISSDLQLFRRCYQSQTVL